MTADIAIIGGGASGLACAIEAKRQAKKYGLLLNVTVYEHLSKPAKKILATGNGRCNFCNTNLTETHYYGNPTLIKSVLSSKFSDTLEFFKTLGVLPYFENGRIYPRSEQASSVRDALINTCNALKINIVNDCEITEIKPLNSKFRINENDFDAVIIATGGKSQKVHGSDGSGYKILNALGHKTTKIAPALTALIVSDKLFKRLKGLRIKGNFSLYGSKKLLKEEFGEIQFTENSLSGIPVLNVSHFANSSKNVFAVIDVCSEFTKTDLISHFYERRYKSPSVRLEDVLSGLIPQKLAYYVMNRAEIAENTLTGKLTDKNIEAIVSLLKNLDFKIQGVRDFDYSQVTMGGIDSSDLDLKTLMSKKHPGIFVCGEILDVNGDCGGYNLHFAWSSGRLAGACAVKYLNNKR